MNHIKTAKFSKMKDGISNTGKQAKALEKILKGEIITIQMYKASLHIKKR